MIYPSIGGFTTFGGRFAGVLNVALASAIAASGASGTGEAMDLGDRGTLRLDLTVPTLGSGTSLTVTIKTSADGSTWRTVAAFTAVSAASATSAERKSFAGCDRYVRADWALAGGTTTATFSVTGDAV